MAEYELEQLEAGENLGPRPDKDEIEREKKIKNQSIYSKIRVGRDFWMVYQNKWATLRRKRIKNKIL